MKKLLVFALAGVMWTGCAQKAPKMSAYEQYEDMMKRAEQQLELVDTEEQQMAVMDDLAQKSIDLIEKNANTGDAYRIAKDMVYGLDTDQKARVFNSLNRDSLEAYGLEGVYQAFLAEQKTAVGQIYTDFETTRPDGTTLKLSELLAEHPYVLIDFWASWCRPCRELMPSLKQLYAASDGQLEILGVSLDDSRSKWLGAIEALELDWQHGSELMGWEDPNAVTYGVSGIPCTILIRASDGRIIARDEHDIQKLRSLMAE